MTPEESSFPAGNVNTVSRLIRRHLRIGWWSLFFFATAGIVLEALHGLKLGYYLDVGNETRRLMFTLAHAHGTLLSLVHIAFAASLGFVTAGERHLIRCSRLFILAGLLLPAGFLVGGLVIYRGDPNLGILLVPIGAVCLLWAIAITARSVSRSTVG
ncbi:MAG: hypothetical protein R3C19_21730 [Planctomycetaceae bacterium]